MLLIEDTRNKLEEQTASYKWTDEVQDFSKITHHLKRFYKIHLRQKNNNQRTTTCNLETLGFWPIIPKYVPTLDTKNLSNINLFLSIYDFIDGLMRIAVQP
jgi:hypothetical protein